MPGLFESCDQMKRRMDEAEQIFYEVQEREDRPDFYEEVKPFVDKVKGEADIWKEEASAWVQTTSYPYLHESQMEDTYDNIMNASLQAYQRTTKEKQFKETLQAVEFILNSIQTQLTQES
ncbi:DUF1798 family protein [Marinococcus luteus]|uniref:DUF1798 family protein n=1 Tax=Marinococcus luteus TaxID=1122204 RepID=UPI002ACCBCB0|nr:DUF1798 family protein [Marinococcus luteus]MDZ5782274.1 DUF1798 family protein [Marinococcus luteus]